METTTGLTGIFPVSPAGNDVPDSGVSQDSVVSAVSAGAQGPGLSGQTGECTPSEQSGELGIAGPTGQTGDSPHTSQSEHKGQTEQPEQTGQTRTSSPSGQTGQTGDSPHTGQSEHKGQTEQPGPTGTSSPSGQPEQTGQPEKSAIPPVFLLKEHESFESGHIPYIRSLGIRFERTAYEGTPKYLGISPDDLRASYYVGADWLSEKENKAVVVVPKIKDVDYVEMYMGALQFAPAAPYFSKFYHIDFQKPPIRTTALRNQLTPLLIIHFLSVMERLAARGLQKGYVQREENLPSKIRGRIQIATNLRRNVINKREDRFYCRYPEYSTDIPENRLLKKALTYAHSFLYRLRHHPSYRVLNSKTNHLLSKFAGVSENVALGEIKKDRKSKLYKEYQPALRLAVMILKHFSFSLRKTQAEERETPVFWIDMARLYEVYVYSLLYGSYGDTIRFQEKGDGGTAIDFIKTDESLLIDAKYKPRYEKGNRGILEDIRQLSGYARDEEILKHFAPTDQVIPCVIIYPRQLFSPSQGGGVAGPAGSADTEAKAGRAGYPALGTKAEEAGFPDAGAKTGQIDFPVMEAKGERARQGVEKELYSSYSPDSPDSADSQDSPLGSPTSDVPADLLLSGECKETNRFDPHQPLLLQCTPIKAYRHFYKISVPLPRWK